MLGEYIHSNMATMRSRVPVGRRVSWLQKLLTRILGSKSKVHICLHYTKNRLNNKQNVQKQFWSMADLAKFNIIIIIISNYHFFLKGLLPRD